MSAAGAIETAALKALEVACLLSKPIEALVRAGAEQAPEPVRGKVLAILPEESASELAARKLGG